MFPQRKASEVGVKAGLESLEYRNGFISKRPEKRVRFDGADRAPEEAPKAPGRTGWRSRRGRQEPGREAFRGQDDSGRPRFAGLPE
jgi:hypothetical protein